MLVLTLVLIPLIVLSVDAAAQFRASRHGRQSISPDNDPNTDYTIVVPIYGSARYLENIDFLEDYGAKVLLATSSFETPEFYRELSSIATKHGFRIHRAKDRPPAAELGFDGRRAVGGTLRDLIVRDSHASITSKYVICIDGDTRTHQHLDQLVAEFVKADLDLASVRLEVANRDNILCRLQAHEYNMAMRLRLIMPWMVSGACHIARTPVHRTLMQRHSLFFQGNDVELGLLGVELGYRVGHIPFAVPTTVPATLTSWWRQRRAWAGGEFRLMAVNLRLSLRHPFLYLYGLIIVFAMLPFRWYSVTHPVWAMLGLLGLYFAALLAVNWRTKDLSLLAYPLYALVYSLVLVPIGIISYVSMAIRYRNAGIIRPHGSADQTVEVAAAPLGASALVAAAGRTAV